MKIIKYTILAAMVAFNTPCIQAQSIATEYVAEFGMYLNQLCAYGGPMYQSLQKRMNSIDWNRNLQNQIVPVVTRQEILELRREKERIRGLLRIAIRRSLHGDSSAYYALSDLSSKYTSLICTIEIFARRRPDAIQ